MNYNEFLVEITKRSHTSRQRYGQLFFNTLYEIRPDLGDLISGTENDPYYLDVNKNGSEMDRISQYIEARW